MYPENPNMPPGQQLMPPTLFQDTQQMLGQQGMQAAQPMDRMSQAFNSPWMAMAGAALDNLATGQNRYNPIQQYQAAVASQANQRLERARLNRSEDPYWAFEEGKRRGIIPPDMDFFTYRDRARQGRFKPTTYAPDMGTINGKKVMVATKYDPNHDKCVTEQLELPEGFVPDQKFQSADVGSGIYALDPVTGEPISYYKRNLKPGEQPDVMREQSAAQTQGTAQANQDAEFRTAAASLPSLELALQDTLDLKNQIEGGQFQNTGFFEGRVGRFTDKETAKLYAKQVLQSLQNLKITNLAPVTEQEIRMIEGLYASVLQDPEANIGALEAAAEMLQKKIANVRTMGDYWMQNGNTLKDYGIYQMMQSPGGSVPPPAGGTLPPDLRPPQ